MCGIAGLVGSGARDPAILAAMTAKLAHRGPDDEGLWSDRTAGVALGHRRLSIVDLSPAGHEPMESASGRLVVTYNGEIYNHAELRSRLDDEGRAPPSGWRGHSDIETFLEAIDHWGLDRALDAAVGMFAFALWDRKDRTLRLVRDRFGEKPLYYGSAGRDFVFASELKAIRQHPAFEAEIDRDSLADYFELLCVPAPRSIYTRIFKVEPGCVLTLDASDEVPRLDAPAQLGDVTGNPRAERYWNYAEVVREGARNRFGRHDDALEAVEHDLAQAIRGQAIADVPVGAFLSGGIDSSSVVALYQKHSSVPVRTFTIGFAEDGFDEAGHARAVAAHLGTIHHDHYLTAGEALAVIPHLSRIYDEPFADSSQIPTYLVSRFARAEVKVALTGDGGDEMFGGYNRHVMMSRLWRRVGWMPRPLRRAALSPFGGLSATLLARLGGIAGQTKAVKAAKALGIAGRARDVEDFAERFIAEGTGRRALVERTGNAAGLGSTRLGAGADVLDRLTYADATRYLPDDILCKVDRASMAVSLETRVPFLDHRLAATAARVPPAMKTSAQNGKLILRSLVERHVPKAMIDRPKAGFAVPLESWLRGPLRDWSNDLLTPARIAQGGLLDPAAVRVEVDSFAAGDVSALNRIWALLMFESFRDSHS